MNTNRMKLSAVAAALLAMVATTSWAAKPAAKKKTKQDKPSVEMFDAIKAGEINVRMIAKNKHQANLLVENKTDRPLSVKLPEVFAGRPVLAQGGFFQGDENQDVGGGAGFAVNVLPEKIRKVQVACLCLDHGKPDPNPHIKYVIAPIETVTTKADVIEVVKGHASGRYPEKIAQAAAWHLENGVSFAKLASMKNDRLGRPDDPVYSRRELRSIRNVVADATSRAKSNKRDSDSGYQSEYSAVGQ